MNRFVCGWVMDIFNLCFYLMFPCVSAFQGFINVPLCFCLSGFYMGIKSLNFPKVFLMDYSQCSYCE